MPKTQESDSVVQQYENVLTESLQHACHKFLDDCKSAGVSSKQAHAVATFQLMQGVSAFMVSENVDAKSAGEMLRKMVDVTYEQMKSGKFTWH